MTLTLYKNKSDPCVLNKDLEFLRILRGVAKDPVDMLAPIITLVYPAPIDFNYAYIDSFSRYYFLSSCVYVGDNLCELTFTVDVLESYKADILSLDAIIERNEHIFDASIVDKMQVFNAGHKITHYYGDIEFGESEMYNDTPRYVLNAPLFLVWEGT